MEEPTLADFAGEAGAGEGEPTASDDDTTPARHGDRPDEEADSGVSAVYRWAPSGAACPACGTNVAGRWRADAGFVCGECKEW